MIEFLTFSVVKGLSEIEKNLDFVNEEGITNFINIKKDAWNLNYDLKESNVKEILSALDIFINEYIYYLVIIFFSFEIYLSKRIGLL